MKTNETIKWQEEQALQRYQLIAPLLDESLDNANEYSGAFSITSPAIGNLYSG